MIFGPIAVSALQAAKALGILAWGLGRVIVRTGILAATEVMGFFGSRSRPGSNWRCVGPMLAFDLALSTNPIGAIILGVTALAGAAFLIYEYWQPISKWFSELWAGIKNTIAEAWNFMKPIVDKIAHALDSLNTSGYSQYAGNTNAERDFVNAHGGGAPKSSGGPAPVLGPYQGPERPGFGSEFQWDQRWRGTRRVCRQRPGGREREVGRPSARRADQCRQHRQRPEPKNRQELRA